MKITETELRKRVASLTESIVATEGFATDAGNAVGNVAGSAASLAAAVPRAGASVGNWLGNKAAGAWDATKGAVSDFTGGVSQGAQAGWQGSNPTKLAGGATPAATATSVKAGYDTNEIYFRTGNRKSWRPRGNTYKPFAR